MNNLQTSNNQSSSPLKTQPLPTAQSTKVTSQKKRPIQKRSIRTVIDAQEFDYLLAELTMTRTSLDTQIRRFEQLVTFYLTGLSATFGGLTFILTSRIESMNNLTLMGLLLIAFGIYGTGTFARLCTAKVSIAAGYSILEANRLFFQKHFPDARSFVANRTDPEKYGLWVTGAFTAQVRVLLMVLGILDGGALAVGAGLLQSELGVITFLQGTWGEILLVCTIFFSQVSLSFVYLKRQLRRAQRKNKETLDDVLAAMQLSSP